MGEKLHENHKATTERSYDRIRDQGVPKDVARKIADSAATQTHVAADRRHSDRQDPNRRPKQG